MDWFVRSSAAVEACLPAAREVHDPGAALPLRALASLCKAIVSGYPILYGDGIISKVLGDDMNSNVARLETAALELEAVGGAPGATLGGLLGQRGADGSPPSPHAPGVYGARWVARTLRFVALLLQKLSADPALSIADAGRQTYGATIAPYHMPVMAFVVGFVLRWAPSRAWVLAGPLGGASNEAACAACAALSARVGPVAESISRALEGKGLDFADRISAIPGGW